MTHCQGWGLLQNDRCPFQCGIYLPLFLHSWRFEEWYSISWMTDNWIKREDACKRFQRVSHLLARSGIQVKNREMGSLGDGSVGRDACCQAWWLGLDTWEPCGRRRDTTLQVVLTATYTFCGTYAQTLSNQIKCKKKERKMGNLELWGSYNIAWTRTGSTD